MKIISLNFIFLVLFTLFISCQPGTVKQGLWPETGTLNKPWTRWWWMGNAVDEENLVNQLSQYADAGFGGVEITPIYGAVGYEEKYLQYLSPEWMKRLSVVVREAKKRGMEVDMNLGTGWPFGGPQITLPLAATRLIIQTYTLSSRKPFREKIVVNDPRQKEAGVALQILTARNAAGETIDITGKVAPDGTLDWKPESGEYELTAAFCGKTLQKVKRAAPGGEGYTFDHFSQEALKTYLARFDSAFGGSGKGIRCFFNDSYELAGTNWTPLMPSEFEKRRGYPLQPWLRELTNLEDSSEIARRIRYDYRLTLSDLLLENFMENWREWAHQKKSLIREQAHGSPGNLLDLYAAADIPECETFGSSYFPIPGLRRDSADIRNVDPDPIMLKFASSAANVCGKPLASCESFTWLAEHFKVSLSQCKPEIEQVFLSGMNHVFYHGTTYSPSSAGWPGWLFYASVNFAPSNSFWPHLKGMNQFVTRCQTVLQSGLPDNELLVYWPVADYWMNSCNPNLQFTIHDIDRWLYPSDFYKKVTSWQSQGFSLDFVSDKLLSNLTVRNGKLCSPAGAEYQTLIFPSVGYIPENTFRKALELAEMGALVIFSDIPGDVPGYGNLTARRSELSEMITALNLTETAPGKLYARKGAGEVVVTAGITELLASRSIYPEKIVQQGLKFIRRVTKKGVYYFLVNHTSEKVDDFLVLNKTGKFNYLLDPLTGNTGMAATQSDNGLTTVRIQLLPGESVFLYSTGKERAAPEWKYTDDQQKAKMIPGPWKLIFREGGPVLPVPEEMDQPKPWTETGDACAADFSGTAVYSTLFTLEEKEGSDYLLRLGKLYESARIIINGKDAGIIWSLPCSLRIGKFLQNGENRIEIEVANLMANRIRWMDRQKIEWRKYHEINFVDINYKPFNASKWKTLPSGLEGPVTITEIP